MHFGQFRDFISDNLSLGPGTGGERLTRDF